MEAQINCMQLSSWYSDCVPQTKKIHWSYGEASLQVSRLGTELPFLCCTEHAKGPQRALYLKHSCTLEQGNSLKTDSLELLGWDRLEMCPCSWDERRWVSSASPAFQSSSFCCLPCTNPGTVSVKSPCALSQTPAGCASTFPHCLDCYSSLLLIIA